MQKGCLMAVAIHQISPVAHLPLVLGVVRKLNVAALIDTFCPPHPANVLPCGRGVEALLLAILDGHHALSKVGARLEERGMLPLLQPGLTRASLHDYRLGQILEALFAAHLNRVFGAIALNALDVYTISTPWLHQDTTTITLYGAYEEEPHRGEGPVPPRPAYGGPGPRRGHVRMDRPGHDGAARGVYGYGDPSGLSGTTYHGRTGLSLDQEPCCYQPRMAGETGTDCGVGQAHGRGVAGVCRDPAASTPLPP